MSYKAYVFRLRTAQDVDDLDKYINRSNMDGIAFLEFFYIPRKSFQRFKVKATDLVAAITVDRGDLGESLRNEGGIDRHHYFERLENLPQYAKERVGKDMETRIKGWEVAPPPSEDERELGWPSWAKETLSNSRQ